MGEETTFRKLKKALLEMMRGYPEYGYYGKVEFFLPRTGGQSVDLLINHDIIEELPKEDVKKLSVTEEEKTRRWYRLKPRGVDLAISMINLEHSERMIEYSKQTLKYSKKMRCFTIAIIVIGGLALLVGIIQSILTYRLFS